MAALRSSRAVVMGAILVSSLASAVPKEITVWPFGGHGDNLHGVVPGKLYRSAQLSGPKLVRTIREDRIASVLNLRGGGPGDRFYDDEIEACRRAGAQHADVSLSSSRLPTPDEMRDLLAAFDRLPRPILVHCQAGKDRTGLAVTLFESVYEDMPIDRAKSTGLSHRYGHTGHGKAAAMDRFVDLYRHTAEGQGFRTWLDRTYPTLYAKTERSISP